VFSNDKETGTTHKGGVVTKTAHGIKHTKTDYDDGHGERGRKPSDKGPASRYKQTPILDKDDDDLSEGLEELFNLRNKVEEAIKQRLDPKCWTGKHKEGTKIKGGVRVNNCVPNESIEESKERCMQCGMKGCTCAPGKCKCKPVAGWIPGKGFKKAVDEGSVAKKPQPYNEPGWAKNLPKEKLDAIAGPRYKKDKKEQGVAEGSLNEEQYEMMMRNGQVKKFIAKDDADAKRIAAGHGAKSVIKLRGGVPAGKVAEQGVAEAANAAQQAAIAIAKKKAGKK
jgi:hypothetical protein